MSHLITFVDDSALSADQDFMLVKLDEGAHIFYRKSAVTEQVLEDSWSAYRATTSAPPTGPRGATMEEWAEWDSSLGDWTLYVA